MKYLMCVLLLLLAFPAQAQRFSQSDLAHTWIVVGSGAGALDAFGDVINCNFSCTIEVNNKGKVKGKSCLVNIAGAGNYAATITGGSAKYVSATYASWTLSFTIASPSGPLTFKSMNRHQFAYRAWDANGKAVGPFYHGAGRFEADNGMVGLWHFAFNRP